MSAGQNAALRPATEADLAEMVRAATGPLAIQGGGTRRIGPALGQRLETGGLSGVVLYEPGALTLVAKAGTTLAEVDALLAGSGQRLAFDPPDLGPLLGRGGQSTLGGVVAANASGPRRVQVGAARDSLLGIRFVDGRGAVIKNGGRVMKNVTGYDLVKLLAGSHGALGILTEVSFKLQARPEAEATLVATLPPEQGLAALRSALTSPFDVAGAAYDLGRALIRVEGMAGSVAYRCRELQRRLGGEWALVEGAESAALWTGVRDVAAFHGKAGSVWRLSVKPTEALRIAKAVGGEALYDWGGGLVWLLLPEGAGAALRQAIGPQGHATLIRPSDGDADTPAFPPEAPAVAALTRALRAQFDPRGLFTPREHG